VTGRSRAPAGSGDRRGTPDCEQTGVLLREVDLGDGSPTDVRLRGGWIVEHSAGLAAAGDAVIDAGGGALLPGLHDHHLHLRSMAAALRSARCGPPAVRDAASLAEALRHAARRGHGWVRGTGYHESVAGPLDRWMLDGIVADRPVRVQHRSGGLWIVNSAGADRLRLDDSGKRGIERDETGVVTGRLWRLDDWMRDRIGTEPLDLGTVGSLLASFGVTGVTDATPDLDRRTLAELAAATVDGRLPLDILALGAPAGASSESRVRPGPAKLLLPDHDLPPLHEVVAWMRGSRSAGRAVAVHCVTRVALVLALAAFDEVGPIAGDRIEHGAVIPPGLRAMVRERGLRVITQPVFVADRGDDYLAEVDADDVPHLYPYASLLAIGVRTAPSTDAPFGDPDPWRTLVAARDRRTPSGRTLGSGERVAVVTALAGLLSPLDDPGGVPRRVEVGASADLCLLHEPLEAALAEPSADLVRLTISRGAVSHVS
jgi:predicted amidohydrolase YtcJ